MLAHHLHAGDTAQAIHPGDPFHGLSVCGSCKSSNCGVSVANVVQKLESFSPPDWLSLTKTFAVTLCY